MACENNCPWISSFCYGPSGCFYSEPETREHAIIVQRGVTGQDYQVDTFDGTMADAIRYAAALALEHAEKLDVPITRNKFGAYFTTNNGTVVSYWAE